MLTCPSKCSDAPSTPPHGRGNSGGLGTAAAAPPVLIPPLGPGVVVEVHPFLAPAAPAWKSAPTDADVVPPALRAARITCLAAAPPAQFRTIDSCAWPELVLVLVLVCKDEAAYVTNCTLSISRIDSCFLFSTCTTAKMRPSASHTGATTALCTLEMRLDTRREMFRMSCAALMAIERASARFL